MTHIIPGHPIGKPRMTRRDKWKKRPCVLKYRAWCDIARKAIIGNYTEKLNRDECSVEIKAYFQVSDSWSKKKKASMENKPHCQKPDIDNVVKGVLDALLEEDKGVYEVYAVKYWTLREPRVEVWFR